MLFFTFAVTRLSFIESKSIFLASLNLKYEILLDLLHLKFLKLLENEITYNEKIHFKNFNFHSISATFMNSFRFLFILNAFADNEYKKLLGLKKSDSKKTT